jgi:hypothetical protein
MRQIIIGTNMLMKLGAEPLLRQGLISPEQYAEMSRRNALLGKKERENEIIIS